MSPAMGDTGTAASCATAEQIQRFVAPFAACVNEDALDRLACRFSGQYRTLAASSTQHFLPTPLTTLPSGDEQGNFLAIDIGGTNLRVRFVHLLGRRADTSIPAHAPDVLAADGVPRVKMSKEWAWPIGEHLKMDKAEDLFAWIGDCIAEAMADYVHAKEHGEVEDEVQLGITFSFPMTQPSMSEAILMPMGKGFAITSNLNLGDMVLAGFARHCTPANGRDAPLPRLRIAAITNDTIATFASLAYVTGCSPSSRVVMGLIMGTGTNATVALPTALLHPAKRPASSSPPAEHIVINTEWTIRGTDVPLRELDIPTRWDAALDAASEAPGFQPFEYMTAGRYLGELVRLALVEALEQEVGEPSSLPPTLLKRYSLSTTFLATVVERSPPGDDDDDELLHRLRDTFPEPPPPPPPAGPTRWCWQPQHARLLRALAGAVASRSSALIAAAIVGLLATAGELRLDAPGSTPKTEAEAEGDEACELVVAYAGGTISNYPGYAERCQGWIDRLVRRRGGEARVVLRPALDGGVVGAGVLAGMCAAGSSSGSDSASASSAAEMVGVQA